MPTRRVLLLGTTGIEKRLVDDGLRQLLTRDARESAYVYKDLERDFVARQVRGGLPAYLDADDEEQWEAWKKGWVELMDAVSAAPEETFLLGLHGVLVRPFFGVRTSIDLDAIRDFAPTHLITLIDDVYSKWWRTQERAGQRGYMGKPSMSQLVEARRAELLVGDMVRAHVPRVQRPDNWLVAVRHPARVLDRVLLSTERLIPIYLSFPISEPRRMLREELDESGVEEINEFLRLVADFELRHRHIVVFCPLTIDELPLIQAWRESPQAETTRFSLERRWNVADFYGSEVLLTSNLPETIECPSHEIEGAAALIQGDVRVRDYRLVKQSRRLLVFNPYFNGQLSSGVDNEIQYAISLRIPVHIYQDPMHDPGREAGSRLLGSVGALGGRVGAEYVLLHDSAEAALEAATQPD